MISIVDTDALVGLFDKNDALHRRSKRLINSLAEENIDTALLPTTLGEFVTLATIKMGRMQTQNATNELIHSNVIHLEMTTELTQDAIGLYLSQKSKEESLFDCYNMIAARKNLVECILSFDKGYTKNGFVLAGEFVKIVKS